MGIRKYKYYFARPKSEITKEILCWLLVGGMVVVAASSPHFVRNLFKAFKSLKIWSKYPKRNISSAFYRLRKQGLIEIKKQNFQIYVSLTEEGKKKAGIFQINNLKIKKPRRWDKKWRILIFDIPQLKKVSREALRGKLKELGFYQMQKSVWVYPFDCRPEVELLKDFFGFSNREFRFIVARSINSDGDLHHHFNI